MSKDFMKMLPTISIMAIMLISLLFAGNGVIINKTAGLELLGIGKILTGIYVLLLGILISIIMLPKKLAELLNK